MKEQTMKTVYRIKITGYYQNGCYGCEEYTHYLNDVYGSRKAATEEKEKLEAIQDENNEAILHTSLPFDHDKYEVVEQEIIW